MPTSQYKQAATDMAYKQGRHKALSAYRGWPGKNASPHTAGTLQVITSIREFSDYHNNSMRQISRCLSYQPRLVLTRLLAVWLQQLCLFLTSSSSKFDKQYCGKIHTVVRYACVPNPWQLHNHNTHHLSACCIWLPVAVHPCLNGSEPSNKPGPLRTGQYVNMSTVNSDTC